MSVIRDFAPLTLRGAFVKASFDAVHAVFRDEWSKGVGRVKYTPQRTLADTFRALDPITDPALLHVVIATRNPAWVAVYSNADDDDALIGLGANLGHAVRFECLPGAKVSFNHYVRTDWSDAGLYRAKERIIELVRVGSKWRFTTHGPTLPFESRAAYRRAKIGQRFTPRMLFAYLDKLGLQPLEDRFFVVNARRPALVIAYPVPRRPDWVNADGTAARWKRQAEWIAETDWNAALEAQWDGPRR